MTQEPQKAGTFAVSIKMDTESYGWAALTISLDGQSVEIACSNACHPFQDLLAWAKALDSGEIPAPLEIDEETDLKTISVRPGGGSAAATLRITGRHGEGETFLKGPINPKQAAQAFRQELKRFFLEEFDPERWEDHEDNNDARLLLSDPWLAGSVREARLFQYADVGELAEGLRRVSKLHLERAQVGGSPDFPPGIWGYIDENAEELVKPQYIYATDFKHGVALVCKGEWEKAPFRVPCQSRSGVPYYAQGYSSKEELWGMIDRTGRAVIPCIYAGLYVSEDGKYVVAERPDGASLVMNLSGKAIFEPEGRALITYERDGLVTVCRGEYPEEELVGLYDLKSNKWRYDCEYDDITVREDGRIECGTKSRRNPGGSQ